MISDEWPPNWIGSDWVKPPNCALVIVMVHKGVRICFFLDICFPWDIHGPTIAMV